MFDNLHTVGRPMGERDAQAATAGSEPRTMVTTAMSQCGAVNFMA